VSCRGPGDAGRDRPSRADGTPAAHLAFPDFLLEHRETPDRSWWLEIIGFWTSDYIQHKLATYRAARLPRVILCIDAKRSIDERQLPANARIVRFTKSIPVDQILGIIDVDGSDAACTVRRHVDAEGRSPQRHEVRPRIHDPPASDACT
jgi:hypothetical protein